MNGMESGNVSFVDGAVGIEPLPTTTGADMQAQFGRMKARLVARYKLVAVPGRPEELVRPVTSEGVARRGVSIGYGCRCVRVRLMAGREWVRSEDFQIEITGNQAWKNRLYSMCDTYFGYVGQDSYNRKLDVHQTLGTDVS